MGNIGEFRGTRHPRSLRPNHIDSSLPDTHGSTGVGLWNKALTPPTEVPLRDTLSEHSLGQWVARSQGEEKQSPKPEPAQSMEE